MKWWCGLHTLASLFKPSSESEPVSRRHSEEAKGSSGSSYLELHTPAAARGCSCPPLFSGASWAKTNTHSETHRETHSEDTHRPFHKKSHAAHARCESLSSAHQTILFDHILNVWTTIRSCAFYHKDGCCDWKCFPEGLLWHSQSHTLQTHHSVETDSEVHVVIVQESISILILHGEKGLMGDKNGRKNL